MEDLISAFGIDWRLIAIQIFNFALLAGLLWYFLYEPVLKMLDARRDKVAKGLQDAEAATAAREAAETEKKEILGVAHKEAEAVVARASTAGDEKRAAILKQAEEESARRIAAAEKAGEQLKEKLRQESEAEVAQAAILAAEKILRSK